MLNCRTPCLTIRVHVASPLWPAHGLRLDRSHRQLRFGGDLVGEA